MELNIDWNLQIPGSFPELASVEELVCDSLRVSLGDVLVWKLGDGDYGTEASAEGRDLS